MGALNKHGQQQILDSGFYYKLKKKILQQSKYIIKAVLRTATCPKNVHLKRKAEKLLDLHISRHSLKQTEKQIYVVKKGEKMLF